MLEGLPPERKAKVTGLFRAAKRFIDAGVVAANHRERKRHWKHWHTWATHLNVDPCLQVGKREHHVLALIGFALGVRDGDYGRGNKVRAETAQVALRAIGTTFEMDLKKNPLYRSEQRHIKPIERLIEGMRRADPPSRPKLAVPRAVALWLAKCSRCSNLPKQQAVGDLGTMAFCHLLRVGEHTIRNQKKTTRTKQFTIRDVTLFKDGKELSRRASLNTLLQADSGTLYVRNQKNGVKGQNIHHHATHKEDCPAKALARRVHHIMQHTTNQDTIISAYFEKGQAKHMTNEHINNIVKKSVLALGLNENGYSAKLVSSHSLRAGGAMAMKLNGIDRDTIRKVGRWSSDTFLMCTHEQISAVTRNVSLAMSNDVDFHNIAGPTLQGYDML